MTPDQLKNSILQLAIQGKLVEQRPEEGTAEELFNKIKIALPEETYKPSKSRGKNIIQPIPLDNLPFDIPSSWEWVRLGTIGFTNIGLTYKPTDISNEGVIVLRSSNIKNDRIDYTDIVRVKIDVPENKMCHKGDLLICVRNGSKKLVGKSVIIDNEGFSYGAFMAIFRSVCNKYLLQVINSAYFRNSILGDTDTTTINQITQDVLKNVLIPLPPLAEQQRIVAKIEELLPIVEKYGEAYNKLEALNKNFPAEIKKSILQYAIQGKLVEQRPEEGTAEELFKQIQTEKQELIKQGKIKKDKNETTIFKRGNSYFEKIGTTEKCIDDELPFEIPNSWRWARLGNISTYGYSKQKQNALNADKNTWCLELEDIEKGGKLLEKKKIAEKKAVGDKTIFYKGDILYSKLRPYLLKILVADDNGICTPEIVPFKAFGNINHNYFVNYLKSPFVDSLVNSQTYGMKMPRAGAETLLNLLVPLPPLVEQQRIVAKIEELLALADTLTNNV